MKLSPARRSAFSSRSPRSGAKTERVSRGKAREPEPSLLQMRNFIFEGNLSSSCLMQGKGLLITDEGLAYCGELKHDRPHGYGLLFFDNQVRFLMRKPQSTFAESVRSYCVISNWAAGLPSGPTLIHSDSHCLLTNYKEGFVHGLLHRLSFETSEWRSYEFKNGTRTRLVYSGSKVPSGLRNNVQQNRLFLHYVQRSFPELAGRFGPVDFVFRRAEEFDHFGFMQNDVPQGLCLKLKNFRIVEAGVFAAGRLHGYGIRKLGDSSFYEGYFREGGYQGFGLFFSESRGEYIVGAFSSSKCVRVYDQGRGRGRDVFIRIKDLQVRNHPKVINKMLELSPVANFLLDELERLQQVPTQQEEATPSKDQLTRLASQQKIDRLNRLIEEESLGTARIAAQLQSLGKSTIVRTTQEDRMQQFAHRVKEFRRDESAGRGTSTRLEGSRRRRIFEEAEWSELEVGEQMAANSVLRLKISRV